MFGPNSEKQYADVVIRKAQTFPKPTTNVDGEWVRQKKLDESDAPPLMVGTAIAKQIQDWRRELKLTQKDLARQGNMDLSTLQSWEQKPNQTPFNASFLAKINKALGIARTPNAIKAPKK